MDLALSGISKDEWAAKQFSFECVSLILEFDYKM